MATRESAQHAVWMCALVVATAIVLYVGAFFCLTTYRPDPSHWADAHSRIFPNASLMTFWTPMRLYDRWANPATSWIERDDSP
ncbi:MAG: hypothetical protein H0W72_08290 [Planctomycetes bacterium]|nr:hypothetical protein [Planctomycetota bacterium]